MKDHYYILYKGETEWQWMPFKVSVPDDYAEILIAYWNERHTHRYSLENPYSPLNQ